MIFLRQRSTSVQVADILTKELSKDRLKEKQSKPSLINSPKLEGEC